MLGLVAIPAVLFLVGARRSEPGLIKLAAVLTLVGVVINRLNVTVIGFQWNAPVRYVPSWQEVLVTLGVISAEIWVFRWVVTRMPVLDFRVGADRRDSSQSTAATAA
jgi:Ni/Fe-hydrogenase subunit HybB-like protein